MTNKTTNSFIQVNDIVLRFKKDILLDHVSYQCEQGKIHGIVGRNGSGKTLLMKCICGFIRPNEGHIYVRDKEIGKDIDFTPDTGIIIEPRDLFLIIPAIVISKYWLLSTIVFHEKTLKTPCIR